MDTGIRLQLHVQDPPDFAALFPPEGAGQAISPRTAALLHDVLLSLGRAGRSRLAELGGRPVHEADDDLFSALPESTWCQGASWRERFVAVFDLLAWRLSFGRLPLPDTPAEEVALLLGLAEAKLRLTARREPVEATIGPIPPASGDFDWNRCLSQLFRHDYVPLLFDPAFSGLEDPANCLNRRLALGDYRPSAWFTSLSARPRDIPRDIP
jgi:hypothetical protein